MASLKMKSNSRQLRVDLQEVVERIAEAAMQTESFEELEQSLSNDLGAGISLQPNTNINKIMPFAGWKAWSCDRRA